jgi:hypothetical protein
MAVKSAPSAIAAAIDRRMTTPVKFVGRGHFTLSLLSADDVLVPLSSDGNYSPIFYGIMVSSCCHTVWLGADIPR